MLPKVSVILITYNRAKFLPRALDSALRQTYKNIEICIMDDASTDETHTVVKPYLKNKQIKYVRNESNVGFSRNVQKGLTCCISGEYFIVLSDDDKFIDNYYIDKAMQILLAHKEITFVFGNYQGEDMYTGKIEYQTNYNIADRSMFHGKALWDNLTLIQPYWGTCVFRKSTALEIGGFWNSFSGMDVLFMLGMALEGNVAYIKSNMLSMGTNGVTVGIKKSLDLQYLNMDFIRAACILAEYKGFEEAYIDQWRETNLTHLLTLMFRDYVFENDGKDVIGKVMDLYTKALKYGDEKYLVQAQARYINFLLQKS